MQTMRVVMTVAGSDSGGGAGIQADLRTFAALGVHGTSVLTAVTAQDTQRVAAVHAIPPDVVRRQIDVVRSDMDVRAVKTGMLVDEAVIDAVMEGLNDFAGALVVDPVMVATSGDPLLKPAAVSRLRDLLVRRASLVTPNLPELRLLVERDVADEHDQLVAAARELVQMGAAAVLVKGGHRSGDADDILVTGSGAQVFSAERLGESKVHGTGCALSAALTAYLARGRALDVAVGEAKNFITASLMHTLRPGRGAAVPHHLHEYYGVEGLP